MTYHQYYYTVDDIENDPSLFLSIVVSDAELDFFDKETEKMEMLAKKAAHDFYILSSEQNDWPVRFYIYNEAMTLLSGFLVKKTDIGEFGKDFIPELIKEKEAA